MCSMACWLSLPPSEPALIQQLGRIVSAAASCSSEGERANAVASGAARPAAARKPIPPARAAASRTQGERAAPPRPSLQPHHARSQRPSCASPPSPPAHAASTKISGRAAAPDGLQGRLQGRRPGAQARGRAQGAPGRRIPRLGATGRAADGCQAQAGRRRRRRAGAAAVCSAVDRHARPSLQLACCMLAAVGGLQPACTACRRPAVLPPHMCRAAARG